MGVHALAAPLPCLEAESEPVLTATDPGPGEAAAGRPALCPAPEAVCCGAPVRDVDEGCVCW